MEITINCSLNSTLLKKCSNFWCLMLSNHIFSALMLLHISMNIYCIFHFWINSQHCKNKMVNTVGPLWNMRMRCLQLVVLHVNNAFLKAQGCESGQPIGAASTFTCIHAGTWCVTENECGNHLFVCPFKSGFKLTLSKQPWIRLGQI